MDFNALKGALEGELFTDATTLRLYATDASAYREMPKAVRAMIAPLFADLACGAEIAVGPAPVIAEDQDLRPAKCSMLANH